MIKDSGKKLFDIVLVWKFDRFARNRFDSANYKMILKKNGVHLIIVPKDLFDRVQKRLDKNKRAPACGKADEEYLLTTKLFYGKCGALMFGESGTSATGRTYYYYKYHSFRKTASLQGDLSVDPSCQPTSVNEDGWRCRSVDGRDGRKLPAGGSFISRSGSIISR